MVHKDANLSMAVTTTPEWDFGQCVDGWARLGLKAIGVQRAKLEEYGIKKGIKKVKDSGLKVSSYHGIGGPYEAEPDRFEKNLDRAFLALETAAELGTDCGLVVAGPLGDRLWDQAARDYSEALERILPTAKQRGVKLAIEPLHPIRAQWTFVNTLKDGIDLAIGFDDPSVGVVFDFWQHWWERDIDGTISRNVDRIFLVHVSDYKKETLTLPDRAMLGEGVIPVRRLLKVLKDAGYHRYYELEIITGDLDNIGYDKGLPQLVEAYERLKP